MLLVSLFLFALVLALPAVPSMIEIGRPKDDGRLRILETYVRDPRWFGRSFRLLLAPFVAARRGAGDAHTELHLRTDEDAHWAPELVIAPSERLRGIGVGERVVVGHGAGIRDAYALENLIVEDDVVARTLTSDDTLQISDRVRILRWIDADGVIDVGADSDLGLSASGGSRVVLHERVRFERVWGAPVVCVTPVRDPVALAARAGTVIDEASVHDGKSVIVYGPVTVAAGTQIPQHLKVHGSVAIEPGVRVAGNIIARGDVTIASTAHVAGHIFAEGNVRLGPGTRVAHEGVEKTVYATGHVLLAGDVEVFGWIVSEDGGQTL